MLQDYSLVSASVCEARFRGVSFFEMKFLGVGIGCVNVFFVVCFTQLKCH